VGLLWVKPCASHIILTGLKATQGTTSRGVSEQLCSQAYYVYIA